MYINGSGLKIIANALNSEGIPSPTGKQWNTVTINKMLRQEKYVGDTMWQKTWSEFMGPQFQINRGQQPRYYIKDSHPPIIDRATFELAAKVKKERTHKAVEKLESPFQHKLICGKCGRMYSCVEGRSIKHWQCSHKHYTFDACDSPKIYDRDVRIPRSSKSTKKVCALTVEEQKKLIKTMENTKPPKGRNDMRTQLFIEMFSGMRMGEINALREGDIDLENGVIHVSATISRGLDNVSKLKDSTKTKAGQRDIPISDMLRPYIVKAIENKIGNPDGLLFVDCNTRKALDTGAVNSYLQRISEKAGIPFYGQHALRHTFATRCIESGIDPVVLKTWLGHRDIHTTIDTYTDVFDNMNKGAIDQFDDYMKGI